MDDQEENVKNYEKKKRKKLLIKMREKKKIKGKVKNENS